jgi:hypothetical protein
LIRGDAGWLLKHFLLFSKESTIIASAIDLTEQEKKHNNDVTVAVYATTTPATKNK